MNPYRINTNIPNSSSWNINGKSNNKSKLIITFIFLIIFWFEWYDNSFTHSVVIGISYRIYY